LKRDNEGSGSRRKKKRLPFSPPGGEAGRGKRSDPLLWSIKETNPKGKEEGRDFTFKKMKKKFANPGEDETAEREGFT